MHHLQNVRLCGTDLFTITIGLGLGFTIGYDFGIDGHGNIGLTVTVGGGLEVGANASATQGIKWSNADNLQQTTGEVWDIGASGGLGPVAGGDIWGGDGYDGFGLNFGTGLEGTLVEGHGFKTYTCGFITPGD